MKNSLGQYFTTNNGLKEKLYQFMLNNPDLILEPSIGQGDLVTYFLGKNPNIVFDMYEIDDKIKLLDNVDRTKVIYDDFIKQNINKLYKTIIGNPPYIKTDNTNLYIQFIKKCYDLLDPNTGELIFIVPSEFFKLTSASSLINMMMSNGSFTHIYHPHNEKLFENASIDIIIFRYCKNPLLISNQNTVLYNDQQLYISNNDGLITFHQTINQTNIYFKDYFDIYVGLVSGKDEVYKNNDLGNIRVLTGENRYDNFIFIENYPTGNQNIDDHLFSHKKELLKRGIRKFNERNWFEWGAPRNISSMRRCLGRNCIYISNLTRRSIVAFVGQVTYFGGSLIMLLPKENLNIDLNLNTIVDYINSDQFKSNFMFSGRFKIGHRQISNSILQLPNYVISIPMPTPNHYTDKAIIIQKWFRGSLYRLKRLPLIMYQIQRYLKLSNFSFSTQNEDGRINSCIDESEVIDLITAKFRSRIKKPSIRMWYDILLYDNYYGWLPVNIKTTTTLTADNTGNLAMCVYSYTDEILDIHRDRSYENGKMSDLLFEKLEKKQYNKNHKKDYYFIVLNKNDPNDIIINSVKGLTELTSNVNNLPYQICWNKNREFKYVRIDDQIKQFIKCIQKSSPSWKERFLNNMRTLNTTIKLKKSKYNIEQLLDEVIKKPLYLHHFVTSPKMIGNSSGI